MLKFGSDQSLINRELFKVASKDNYAEFTLSLQRDVVYKTPDVLSRDF